MLTVALRPLRRAKSGFLNGCNLCGLCPQKFLCSYRKTKGLTIGLCYQVTVENRGWLLPSDRTPCYQVTVDNIPEMRSCYQVTVDNPMLAVARFSGDFHCYQVTVDNSAALYSAASARAGLTPEIIEYFRLVGGSECQRVMPLSSRSSRAALYCVQTCFSSLRKKALKLFMRP